MSLGSKWLNWTKASVCIASFLVLINASPTNDFQARSFLHQWVLLSPFLFILVAEGLASLLRNVCCYGCSHPFSLGDNLHIDLLQFVDDTMLSVQPSLENIWTIKALLHGLTFVRVYQSTSTRVELLVSMWNLVFSKQPLIICLVPWVPLPLFFFVFKLVLFQEDNPLGRWF